MDNNASYLGGPFYKKKLVLKDTMKIYKIINIIQIFFCMIEMTSYVKVILFGRLTNIISF